MSYIRSTSNPEGLYIWGDDKNVNIVFGKELIKYIPIKIFDGLLNKYNKSCGNGVKFKGASIKETFISDGKKQTKLQKAFGVQSGNFKMRLSYGDWHKDMWKVTWEYIAQHNGRYK